MARKLGGTVALLAATAVGIAIGVAGMASPGGRVRVRGRHW